MTWLRLDDKYARHRKIRSLSDAAFRLHTTAMLHCAEEENDGAFSRADLDVLPSIAKGKRLEGVITDLEAAGLWERRTDGWAIHDFLDWNPSKADLATKRASRSQAGALGGKRSGEARRQAIAPPTGEANSKQLLRPCANPVPSRPVPEEKILPTPPPLGLTGHSAQEQAAVVWTDEHETICPLDLEQKAIDVGVVRELAGHYRTSEESVLQAIREFVAHWTVGGGHGKRRRGWMGKLRGWIKDLAAQGKLLASGEVDHERRKRELARDHREWLMREARGGQFGLKIQAGVQSGKITVEKLEAWWARRRAKSELQSVGSLIPTNGGDDVERRERTGEPEPTTSSTTGRAPVVERKAVAR